MRIRAGKEAVNEEKLSAFEKRLCNALQSGLPIKKRPYAEIGRALGSNEDATLKQTRELVKRGIIRRIGAVVNWRAIGKASTLVAAACASGENLKRVVAAVKAMEGVSHNYLREHRYNLWFTLQADSQKNIEAILGDLSQRFGVAFHGLPVERTFKLDVRFDAESEGQKLLKPAIEVGQRGRAKLDEIDRRILAALETGPFDKARGGLEVVAQPYEVLCKDGLTIDEVLSRIEGMIGRGAINRLGAIVDQHKLGFAANAMFVCRANGRRAVEIGKALAHLQNVSHCYERRPFKGWPFNLFAMMHGRSMAEIRRAAEAFVKAEGIEKWDVLRTVRRN